MAVASIRVADTDKEGLYRSIRPVGANNPALPSLDIPTTPLGSRKPVTPSMERASPLALAPATGTGPLAVMAPPRATIIHRF